MSERKRIPPLSAFEEEIGYTRALRVDNRIIVSGSVATRPDGSVPEDAGEQADFIFSSIIGHIETLGGTSADVVRIRMFVTNMADADAISASFSRALKTTRPAATLVAVAALYDPRWKVEIEAEAIVSDS